MRITDLLCTYTTCALEATCAYDVRLVRVSELLRTYSTTFARKQLIAYVVRLLRSRQLIAYVGRLFALKAQ